MRHFTRRAFAGLVATLAVPGGRLRGATGQTTKIGDALGSGIDKRKIPAIVAMAASERSILYSGAFGKRDSPGPLVTADSIFSIASMTKPITTVAALQLVEQGKVKLDAPVSEYFPRLANLQVLEGFDPGTGKPKLRPAKTPVTLKHLLTHTSGICYDIWDPQMFQYTSKVKTPDSDPPTLMFEPGTRWQYGMGVDWAGRLVESVSGMNLEAYFQARILGPLAMRDTSYVIPESKFDRLVTAYTRQADGSLQ